MRQHLTAQHRHLIEISYHSTEAEYLEVDAMTEDLYINSQWLCKEIPANIALAVWAGLGLVPSGGAVTALGFMVGLGGLREDGLGGDSSPLLLLLPLNSSLLLSGDVLGLGLG